MLAASSSQPATVLEFNKCGLFNGQSPERSPNNSIVWDQFVRQYLAPSTNNHLEPELGNGSNHIRLSGLRRWRAGREEPKGSALHIEHFLHLRALVNNHFDDALPIRDLVDPKYVDAADKFLKEWPDFENYIDQVPISDPGVDVDSLGLFSGAKMVQNQVLLDAYLDVSQDSADSFEESISETPLKKGRYNSNFYTVPPANDAADEQIVNEALISFASALTRRWMVQKTAVSAYGPDQTPTGGANTAQAHDWKTVADWTMSRGRFHIRERIRDNDATQDGHMTGLQGKRTGGIVMQSDGHSYGRVLISETDGSLYRISPNSTETLALVEAKKRLRRKNRLKIEWQEAAEVLAWLNLRLRTESEERAHKGGGPLPPRRGLLRPKAATGSSGEKSRCLLLAQDREEIYIVIGEWDALYEQYALEGKFSRVNIDRLDQLRAERNPAVLDAGFLTLHVYGPFGGFVQNSQKRKDSMRMLSTYLLALSLHLSQASCSPLSRRNSPPGSIQLPPHRGEPCCPGCTCKCGCEPPPEGGPDPSKPPPEAPKPPSDTSGARAGKQQAPREGSASRESERKTPSIHSSSSHSSGGPDPTPSRGPRPGGRRPDEIRAASAHAQQDPRQIHGSLPLRGRPMAGEQQGARSESQEQASRSRSRARAAAAAAAAARHAGQGSGPAAGSRHPPLPQAPGGSFPAPTQQRQPQQHEQRDAHGQSGQGAQPHHDPRVAPIGAGTQHQVGTAQAGTQAQLRPQTRAQTAAHPQQAHQDPSSGSGPSYPTQAGPSRQRPQARPARLEAGEPSQPQQNPEEAPTKKDKKNHPLISPSSWRFPKMGKDKKGKDGKGKGDKKDEGGVGKK